MPKRSASKMSHQCDCETKRRRRIVIFTDSSDSEDESRHTESNHEAKNNGENAASANKSAATTTSTDVSQNGGANSATEVTTASTDDTTPALDPEILTALGTKTDDEPEYGAKIHDNLSQLWVPLLKKGMSKEDRDKIVKNYAVPENCKLLQAPKLNLEISAAATEAARFRDKKLVTLQQQLGVGITAINRGIESLLSQQEEGAPKNLSAIRHLSDACRILCDLHHMETQGRIKLITPTLDKTFLNIIQDCQRDETLFGNKLSDKIKSSKAIEKQGLQIKKFTLPPAATTPSTSRAPHTRGNWAGPPRYPTSKSGRGSGKKTFSSRRPPLPAAAQTPAAKTVRPQTRAQTRQ